MRRRALSVLPVVVVVAAVLAFVHYYNPLAPKNLDDLLAAELVKMGGEQLAGSGGMSSATQAELTAKWDHKWRGIEESMRKSGASDAEVSGVLATARRHFSHRSEDGEFVYGVPVEAKRIWHRFEPMWIIKFRWGIGFQSTTGNMAEPLSHVRVLCISAEKPYLQLAMQTCG